MKQFLAIESGTSKTAALFIQYEKLNIIQAEEFVCGNNQLMLKNSFNFPAWQDALQHCINYFSSKCKLKNLEVIISLPSKLYNYEKELFPVKKFELKKAFKEKQKKAQNILIRPLLNSIFENQQVFWFSLNKDLFQKIEDFIARAGLTLVEIVYALPLFNKYAEANNYALLNLGGRSSDLLFFQNKKLNKIVTLPIGGEQVIHDLALVMQVSENEARNKLFKYQNLFESMLNKTQGDLLNKVIDERMKELFNLIKKAINEPLEKLYVHGGLANCYKLTQYLENYLQVKTVNLNESFQHSPLFEQVYLMAEDFIKQR